MSYNHTSIKSIGAGMAASGLGGAGCGIGVLFGLFILGISFNPGCQKRVFPFVLLGFALTEAIALFGLMVTFLILFS